MKNVITLCLTLAAFGCTTVAQAAVTLTTSESDFTLLDLAEPISSVDLIQGLIPVELDGDMGWHPANTNPADQLPAFTDGLDFLSTLTGLLNDFPGEGIPTKLIQYTLPQPTNIGEVRVFSGNILNPDGRVFQTYTVEFSDDNGGTFSDPIYVESHLPGTINTSETNAWQSVLTQLGDSTGLLAVGVTDVVLKFYSVDNTGGQYRDPWGADTEPFVGINPFTGIDDGLSHAFVSPLIIEIDIIESLVEPPVPGDANGDGKVDGVDYLVWATNFGPAANPPGSPANGDFDDSGQVDGVDYLIWATNFGQGPNDAAAVPEPTALLIALSGLIGLAAVRRRR